VDLALFRLAHRGHTVPPVRRRRRESRLPIQSPVWRIGTAARVQPEAVQQELSFLRQWLIPFLLLPTLIAGVPMGIIADRYGRTIVFGLVLLGLDTLRRGTRCDMYA